VENQLPPAHHDSAMKMSVSKSATIEVRERRHGSGWYAHVIWGDRPLQQVGGFPTKEEAQRWIDRNGDTWIRERLGEYSTGYDRE
jgi:hypothetical protein